LLNTHLDEQSDAQRRLGASLILTRAKFEAVNTGGVVIITGDFNRLVVY
jgi:endonuclease/exonuclease/phosphatase family metal-dependent hydrolase